MYSKSIILILMAFSTVSVVAEEVSVVAEKIEIPQEKSVIQFETKIGTVTFAHKKHADLSITQCTTCHHEQTAADTIQACHSCHEHKKNKNTEAMKARKAFHTRCIGCHEYTTAEGHKAGPLKQKCKLCHIKEKKK